MFDYSMLTGSSAEATTEPLLIDRLIKYTFMESADEGQLYKNLNERLTTLEISLIIDAEIIDAIIDDAKGFRLLLDEKEEVLMRIDWLERLDKVQQNLSNVQTIEEAQRLNRLISSCQTSPLKNHLITKLDELALSLPSDEIQSVKMTDAEALMEKAIENAGNSFINLGTAGRNFIITDVLKRFGKKATIKTVQKHTKELEQRVEVIMAINESDKLIKQLDSLPIPLFHTLSAERKGRIAETLLENNNWNGLASLDRMIAHLDKAITNEEQQQEEAKNTKLTSDGKAALTLDIKNVEDGRVQLG